MTIGDGSMFSKFDEISKVIRNYIEASFARTSVDVTVLNKFLMDKYKISLPNIDLTNLVNKISSAKKLRREYTLKMQSNSKQEEGSILELKDRQAVVLEAEGSVRELSYTLASKICIMLYKGPLTMDTMKELKEHNYDGSYGSITMKQMYALYYRNQKLETENEQLKSDNTKKATLLGAYEQQYKQLFFISQQDKIKNSDLTDENKYLRVLQEQLHQALINQGMILQSLNQNIESLPENIVSLANHL